MGSSEVNNAFTTNASIFLFGGLGDGFNDDARAFRRALAALSNGGGKNLSALLLPPGRYLVGSEIVVPTGITIKGSGDDTVILVGKTGQVGPFNAFRGADGVNLIFENLRFEEALGTVGGPFRAISMDGPTGSLQVAHVTATPTGAGIFTPDGLRFIQSDCNEVGQDVDVVVGGPYTMTHLGDGLWVGGNHPRQIKGDIDPSAGAGYPAPQASTFQSTNGNFYLKIGPADADWVIIIAVVSPPFPFNGTPTDIESGDAGAPGGSPLFARGDHEHPVPAPTVVSTLTPDNAPALGVSTAMAREDHVHGITAGTPGTIEPDDAPAEGVSTDFSRADHVHGIAAGTAVDIAQANAEGVSTDFARADHVHNHAAQPLGVGTNHAVVTPNPGGVAGFMSPADKTKLDGINPADAVPTTILPDAPGAIGASTDYAREDHEHPIATGIPIYIEPELSPAEGISTEFARADHRHGSFADVPVSTGTANAEGVSTSFSRADHVHRTLVGGEDEGILVGARPIFNFIGAGVTAVDNPGNDSIDVTIPGGGGSGGGGVLVWGNDNIGAGADTRTLNPGRGVVASLALGSTQIVVGHAGTIKNMTVRHNTAAGNGNSAVYTLFKNGAATLLTVTLVTGAIVQGLDLVNTVAVVAGDRLDMRVSKALAVTAANVDVQASVDFA